jgi:D-alanyl-D-alanine carboxypeptidase
MSTTIDGDEPIDTNSRFARLFAVIGLVALLASLPAPPTQAAAIVIDHGSGVVLHQDNADGRWYPASLTKMMTLHLIFDALSQRRVTLDTRWRVSRNAAGQPATRLGLNEGDTISVHDVILALVTRSANDMAVVAAEALGRTEVNFARMMTRRARTIGMQRTAFRNASGLPAPGQVTTARDMAILARALIRNHPTHYHFFNTQEFEYGGRLLTSHNRVLERYSGADGIKTGYIRASGFNLATSAMRDGRRLVAVVLGGATARSRDDEMMQLLDGGFARLASLPPAQVAAARQSDSTAANTEWDFDAADPPTRVARAAAPARLRPVSTQELSPVASGPRTSESGWGIQVGAFQDRETSRRAAERAASLIAARVGRFSIELSPAGANGRPYRARLWRMTQTQSHEACQVLRAQRMDCTPLAPADLPRVASR